MYIEKSSDMYSGLISQVETIIDLDRPEIELIKVDRSKYGVTNYPKCHVHDVLILNIDGKLFYAKGEDVYLRISSRHSLNYRNFLEFSLSLFQFDDCTIPERKFCFLDEPDIAEVNFERVLVQQQCSTIESITDETPPGDILDPKVRELFVFYLSRKERLVAKDGAVYDDVFNHHGRDVIHEVLASVLGQLLGISVPRNYFGYKTSQFKLARTDAAEYVGPEYHRFVLSEAIHDKHPSPFLVDVLNKQFKERNIIWGLSLYREESNPLNLSFFQNEASAESQTFGDLIIAECAHYADLIRSDFLDQVLGGGKDRKPFDYLLPKGVQGPIYTVDFGEILFPELVFVCSEPHYLIQKEARAASLRDYFRRVGELSPESPYRRTVADLVLRVANMDLNFFGRLINAIPEKFLLDHFASGRYCYQTATLTDFLQNQFTIIAQQKDI